MPKTSFAVNQKLSTKDTIKVSNKAFDLCPRYSAQLVSDVKIEESPLWLKRRLSLISTEANNLIDITLLKELISNVKNLVGFCFENGEDKNLQLNIANGLATISIEELSTKIKIDQTSDALKFCANFNFVSYIIDKLSSNAVIIDSSCNEEDIYLIKDGDRNIFFNKIDYLD